MKIVVKLKDTIYSPDKEHIKIVQKYKSTITKNKKKYSRKAKHKKNHKGYSNYEV